MIDTCPKCKKTRAWIGKKDKSSEARRNRILSSCIARINVYFPPDGVL